jgi:hypothetical protein
MSEPRITATAIRVEPTRNWSAAVFQVATSSINRAGFWAADTAQQFGSLVSVLMGPAVMSAYVFALWSLAGSLGFTNTFIYSSGPLSNWLIWLGIAVLVHVAANVLKRHTRLEKKF